MHFHSDNLQLLEYHSGSFHIVQYMIETRQIPQRNHGNNTAIDGSRQDLLFGVDC